ncbi:MAG: GTP 3',8-cyclase MoaA, partial [Proteobacteria bacterium]|nr:GTP 3',8-cyclase MoaA [Pseudomonadota bacterium]
MIAGNRSINYLRISVTDRCNFRCRYCIPASPFTVIDHDKIARYEEILKITRLACELGITKVRITGGEPFVRKDIFSFLEKLCAIESLKDISITSNGSLLTREKIKKLIALGIKRLNFSLDTLDPVKFARITGRDRFKEVWNTIFVAHELGISPVKINSVILRGINDNEIENITALTLEHPFHIRFIEYMPMGDSAVEKQQQILTREVMEKIESRFGKLIPIKRGLNDGPAKKFQIEGAKGIVGFITPISSHFCSECNRLRLTSRGTLRPCLLN